MKGLGFIPPVPAKIEGADAQYPWFWGNDYALDGTVEPWLTAPIGSVWVRYDAGNVAIRLKTVNNGASADWLTVTAA